ncbi:unnamed protein product [Cylindrotheca closterium]|uniref:Helicase-associated domain-containing protein n=1 Tax=Cylindrotheca closterium TaxID=2856 RepID=A0AAD2CJN1_9STRA|nr:unnamed protein product [Cylindrotheca closterium]
MICSANNDKFQQERRSYSNMEDSSLLTLMRRPLPPLEAPSSSPSNAPVRPVMSFEIPFDDPRMEPLPLRPQCEDTYDESPRQSIFDSIFWTEDFSGASFKEEMKMSKNHKISLGQQGQVRIADSSRSSEAPFFNQSQFLCKRKRTNETQPVDKEETTARFRPYQEKQWRAQFQKLIEYSMKNGHCCVPHSYKEDPMLARWVKRQRYQYKKFNDNNPTSTMTTRRIEDLESIGFIWHSHASAWQEKVNDLKAFKQRTGHCNVPSHHPENPGLSTWVKCQRRQYKLYISGSSCSDVATHRFQILESLGFVFEPQLSKRGGIVEQDATSSKNRKI